MVLDSDVLIPVVDAELLVVLDSAVLIPGAMKPDSESYEHRDASLQQADVPRDESCTKAKQVQVVLLHQFSTTSLSMLTVQPRHQLLVDRLGKAKAAAQINSGASIVGLLEFLLSPMMGSISDRIGRRPLMLVAPASGAFFRTVAALWPSALTLSAERVAGDATRAFAGTTMCYAAISDICGTGPDLMPAMARCGSTIGLGMVIAPLVISALSRFFAGSPARSSLAVAAALTVVQLLLEWRFLEETNAMARRPRSPLLVKDDWDRPCAERVGQICKSGGAHEDDSTGLEVGTRKQSNQSIASVNPLGFLRLFAGRRRMRALAMLLAAQCAIDGKLLQDQVAIVQLRSARWSLQRRALWSAAFGGTMALGGQLVSPLTAHLGSQDKFVTLAHATSVVTFLAYTNGLFWFGLLPLIIGCQRRTPTVAWLLSEAQVDGIGRGEMLAMTTNLRAAVDTLGPMVYGLAARLGKPTDVFYAPVFLTVFAEVARVVAANARQV